MENTTKEFYEALTALVMLETAMALAEAQEETGNE